MAGLRIKMDLPTDKELAEMFDAVSLLKRHEVMSATTKAGGRIVVDRAKQAAPRGTDADRRKRSKKQKAAANWNIRLHTTIAMVTRGGNRRSFSIVGPRHPIGNKAYFNSPKSGSRRHVLWGNRTLVRQRKADRNWIVQAFDESRSQQLSAMKTELTKKVNEMLT
jgi:hypothetical protein